jgi:hypothetical protein
MVLLHTTSENNAVAFPLLPNVDRKEQNFNADTTPTSNISNLAPLINLVDIALQSSQKVCRHFLFHNIMVATKEDFASFPMVVIGKWSEFWSLIFKA